MDEGAIGPVRVQGVRRGDILFVQVVRPETLETECVRQYCTDDRPSAGSSRDDTPVRACGSVADLGGVVALALQEVENSGAGPVANESGRQSRTIPQPRRPAVVRAVRRRAASRGAG